MKAQLRSFDVVWGISRFEPSFCFRNPDNRQTLVGGRAGTGSSLATNTKAKTLGKHLRSSVISPPAVAKDTAQNLYRCDSTGLGFRKQFAFPIQKLTRGTFPRGFLTSASKGAPAATKSKLRRKEGAWPTRRILKV